jgi:antitoxin (DNA-binding transcriptional repressor) of toxin-antitoxin stability system
MSVTQSIPIEQAAAKLVELVGTLRPGEEIVLTDHDQPVAKIIPSSAATKRRRAGTCEGMLIINQEDDEHLDDFEEYVR